MRTHTTVGIISFVFLKPLPQILQDFFSLSSVINTSSSEYRTSEEETPWSGLKAEINVPLRVEAAGLKRCERVTDGLQRPDRQPRQTPWTDGGANMMKDGSGKILKCLLQEFSRFRRVFKFCHKV